MTETDEIELRVVNTEMMEALTWMVNRWEPNGGQDRIMWEKALAVIAKAKAEPKPKPKPKP